MRVAQLHSHAVLNGVGTSLATLIRELHSSGNEILLVHRPDAWIRQSLADLPISFFESTFRTRPGDLSATAKAIRAFGADVIHTHGSTAHKYGAIYRILGETPVVATAHSRNFQLHWVFNDRVIAPSWQTAAYHRRVNFVSRRKLRVIPNTLILDTLPLIDENNRAVLREEFRIPRDAFVFGMIGSIISRKNQVDCVRVLSALQRVGVNAHLVLVGPDGLDGHLDKVTRLVARLQLGERVRILGERLEAKSLLPLFDAYLCTSRREECSIANLEAMGSGLPMISTRVGCMEMLLSGGEGGALFDIGDVEAMARFAAELAVDPERRRVVGGEARRLVETQLCPDVIIPQIEAVYREALANDSLNLGSGRDVSHQSP